MEVGRKMFSLSLILFYKFCWSALCIMHYVCDSLSDTPSSINFSHNGEEERAEVGSFVPSIGDTIDVKNLGEFHVWLGDCLH